MNTDAPRFVRLTHELEVSLAVIERIEWSPGPARYADVFVTEVERSYRVEGEYVDRLEVALLDARRAHKVGPYGDVKQIVKVTERDADLLDSFLQDGWSIVETAKTRAVNGDGYVESVVFWVGGDEFAAVPEEYEARQAQRGAPSDGDVPFPDIVDDLPPKR